MNLATRKIQFIQEFLKIQSEETVALLEKILSKEKDVLDEQPLKQFTQEELNQRIDKAEEDFKNNRYTSSADLLKKYK